MGKHQGKSKNVKDNDDIISYGVICAHCKKMIHFSTREEAQIFLKFNVCEICVEEDKNELINRLEKRQQEEKEKEHKKRITESIEWLKLQNLYKRNREDEENELKYLECLKIITGYYKNK
jgi:viroplasmin and RNaseH domain-containing protein